MPPGRRFSLERPGDPEPCDYAIRAIREILDATRIPVFGICLGHQLMGLASGARTVKMKFGHHGANHPVKDLDTGQVAITSQNHGFAVDRTRSRRRCGRRTSRSSMAACRGSRIDRPAFCFQGHPEASPGPHDIGYLFDRFMALMDRCRSAPTSTRS
ncbi:MAG: gamma-glutamyl-gamma-aminobutyrate hydrolase family protein [Xanthobacteraceae bacterium]|nr:gamma-glutamyl-gamma-aminobutyrate hydrolase family protein [Xanthobacteraceae bacterium]